jgi:hypothetical protein
VRSVTLRPEMEEDSAAAPPTSRVGGSSSGTTGGGARIRKALRRKKAPDTVTFCTVDCKCVRRSYVRRVRTRRGCIVGCGGRVAAAKNAMADGGCTQCVCCALIPSIRWAIA